MKICKIEGCDKKVHAKGLCGTHYMKAKRSGEIKGAICKIKECDNPVEGGGLCNKHRLQMRRHGKILERTMYDPNEYRVEGQGAYMSLYNKHGNKVAEAIIDFQDLEVCQQYKWGLNQHGYVKTDVERDGKRAVLFLHNFVLGRNVDLHIVPDHVNRNKLDNRKSNLRIATRSQNNYNATMNSNNTSGFKGVTRSGKKWIAQSDIYLGTHDTKEEASEVYKNYVDSQAPGFCGATRRMK